MSLHSLFALRAEAFWTSVGHSPRLAEAIVLIRKDDGRRKCFGFFGGHVRIANEDDHVTYLHLACSGAIEADGATATFTTDGIGFKSFPIVDVHDLNFFSFENVGGFEQIGIHSDASYIVELCLGDFDPMYLRLKNG